MKEIWSADQDTVIGELYRNCEEAVALTLIGPAVVPISITIRSVLQDNSQPLIECEKPEGFELDGELFVFYRRGDLQLMRGFKLDVVRQANRFFRAVVPDHIFEVQRRKFPRVFVPADSTITCAPQNSRRILQAQVIDVSMEGARIFGNLTGLTQGTVLAPLTLTLCFEDKRSGDVVINITEAVVVREIRVREKVELSFHFQSEDTDDLLEKYIDLRVLEQKIYG